MTEDGFTYDDIGGLIAKLHTVDLTSGETAALHAVFSAGAPDIAAQFGEEGDPDGITADLRAAFHPDDEDEQTAGARSIGPGPDSGRRGDDSNASSFRSIGPDR